MSYFAEISTPPEGVLPASDPREYLFCFEEVPLDHSHLNYRLFRSPILSEWRMNYDLVIQRNTNFDLEDISEIIVWQGGVYVSQLVKEIIEDIDDFNHQFWPVGAYSSQRNNSKRELLNTVFYRMNMRRFLFIQPTYETPLDVNFKLSKKESKYISAIQHDYSLREHIEKYPMWQFFSPVGKDRSISSHELYINEELMEELKQAGVSGIKEYSTYQGTRTEMVAAF